MYSWLLSLTYCVLLVTFNSFHCYELYVKNVECDKECIMKKCFETVWYGSVYSIVLSAVGFEEGFSQMFVDQFSFVVGNPFYS